MINRIIVALAFVIVIAFALFEAHEGYRWKQVANARGYRADVCYSWLAQPIAVDVNGRELSRAAVLDGLARQAVPRK